MCTYGLIIKIQEQKIIRNYSIKMYIFNKIELMIAYLRSQLAVLNG